MNDHPRVGADVGTIDGQAISILRGVASAIALWSVDPATGAPRLVEADLNARLLLSGDPGSGGFPVGTPMAGAVSAAAASGRSEPMGVVFTEMLGARTRLSVRAVPLGRDLVATVWVEMPPEEGAGSETEALRHLAGMLGHDVNNILQVAEGNVELALGGADVTARLKAAYAALLRAREITDQLDAISMRVTFAADLDLSALVRDIVPSIRQSLPDGIVLAYALEEDGPWVSASTRSVRQILKNLVRNAAEALPDSQGEIVLSVGVCSVDGPAPGYVGAPAAKGRYGYVEVRDTGEGIDPQLHAKIFEPFYSTRGFGRGLGLPAAESVARAHGGALRLRSVVGEGTAIRVLLPLVPVQVAEVVPLPAEALATVVGRVLVVDDEETLRTLVRAALEPAGFEVSTADDGDTGVEAFSVLVADGGLDCVILDLTMRRMSGVDALRAMRAIEPRVPVIVSSGYSSDEVARQLGGLQPDGILRKPTAISTLIEQVRRAVGRRRRPAG